jgi:hypothetical protein
MHLLSLIFGAATLLAQNPFRSIEDVLPNPTDCRNASGAPGHKYWQQRADYVIRATLDVNRKRISGAETITYHNRSPDSLAFLWLQLDQNIFDKHAHGFTTETERLRESMPIEELIKYSWRENYDGKLQILGVTDDSGLKLMYTEVGTMMRVDLPRPLAPNKTFVFSVKWEHEINDHKKFGGRGGYEYFSRDDNYIFEIAQWFPRMAVYNDLYGWQTMQYLGRGEFALPFGNYDVSLTLPADFVVAATGELQNPEVLKAEWRTRLKIARQSSLPVYVITPQEAKENEASRVSELKTWRFKAEGVRDFAWAASRKFIWDAMNKNGVLCQSFYPSEASPLWDKYSTKAVAHAVDFYSRYTGIKYPWPVAISVNGPVQGMEYPMICFNGPRPDPDGAYSVATRYALISVVIHEVGHNFFPMIVNSDERRWMWMDEGLNSFVQYLCEQEWERDYPSRRGPAESVVAFMRDAAHRHAPIMTPPDHILKMGDLTYGKTAAGLNILRETVMGRETFDAAFKEYCRRWAFKHPYPADFFRTLKQASGVDIDWFVNGWFFGTDPVDLALESVVEYTVSNFDPDREQEIIVARPKIESLSQIRNRADIPQTLAERDPDVETRRSDDNTLSDKDRQRLLNARMRFSDEERAFLDAGMRFYQIEFSNLGGMIMPLIVEFVFSDGTRTIMRIPAEIWRLDAKKVAKVFVFDRPVQKITLDPLLETPDVNRENNALHAPFKSQRIVPHRSY